MVIESRSFVVLTDVRIWRALSKREIFVVTSRNMRMCILNEIEKLARSLWKYELYAFALQHFACDVGHPLTN